LENTSSHLKRFFASIANVQVSLLKPEFWNWVFQILAHLAFQLKISTKFNKLLTSLIFLLSEWVNILKYINIGSAKVLKGFFWRINSCFKNFQPNKTSQEKAEFESYSSIFHPKHKRNYNIKLSSLITRIKSLKAKSKYNLAAVCSLSFTMKNSDI